MISHTCVCEEWDVHAIKILWMTSPGEGMTCWVTVHQLLLVRFLVVLSKKRSISARKEEVIHTMRTWIHARKYINLSKCPTTLFFYCTAQLGRSRALLWTTFWVATLKQARAYRHTIWCFKMFLCFYVVEKK